MTSAPASPLHEAPSPVSTTETLKPVAVPPPKALTSLYGPMTLDKQLTLNSLVAKRPRTAVSFEDYGYGDAAPEPSLKRRRFERRNSKTPAMLMKEIDKTLKSFDFTSLTQNDDDKNNGDTRDKTSPSDPEWDGGLEIAEELVKQLQSRRQRRRGTVL